MKFRFIIIIKCLAVTFLIISCTPVRYQVAYTSNKVLDLRSGKWIVNSIEGDFSYNERQALSGNLLNGLEKAGIDSLYFIDNIMLDYVLPEHLIFELPEDVLTLLQETADYDYIINVKTEKIKNDLGSLMFSPPDYYSTSKSKVSIVAYDINTKQKIFNQQVIASVQMNENDEDIMFSKSASSLIFSALNKGLKEIKKYSIRD